MKKKTLETAVEVIPNLLVKFGDYLKDSKDEVLEGISTGSGSLAFILKIFGKPLIDRIITTSNTNKLKYFGLQTYLEASITQAQKSLQSTLSNIENEFSISAISTGFQIAIQEQKNRIKTNEWTLFFQPKYHPIIIEVVKMVETFLKSIKIEQENINFFKRDYYNGIEAQVKESFGNELYEKHLSEIKKFYLKENETKIIRDSIALSKIGFKENEQLDYETTYAEWRPVSMLFVNETENNRNEDKLKYLEGIESKLRPVDSLIEEFFSIEEDNHLEKILFLVADFGKGKSVFLRNYCANCAKDYLSVSTGYFLIYFNLRTFKDYDEDHHLGIIANYLEKKYSIKIDDDYFRTKRYLFLIDSLDECGELTTSNINKIIESVKKIQNIDPLTSKLNKIIVTSRPFDDGLKTQLQKHKRFVKKNDQDRDVEYFVSIYGFKKDQFNHWLSSSLKKLPNLGTIEAEGLNKEVIESIRQSKAYDIYQSFLEKEIISISELRRPIFSYMLLQLISNSISIDKSGKIGVYLSFLNLLTKEAKYVHDVDYQINLKEQFEARNILHSIAATWQFNKSSANKSEIKKADVCRTLLGSPLNENDTIVLNKFKELGASDIEFLSHSYFGDNNNLLHFQHQSFAEILLAEYYLKVIIKFALDDEFDFEQARVRLSLGEPTEQTMEFFKELVLLFKDSVSDTINVIEKRKLLFPLLASLATIKNNKTTFSSNLSHVWFKKISFEENISETPIKALADWPIDKKVIEQICELCRQILYSNNHISIQKGEFKTSLFDKEVFVTTNNLTIKNIDKWISHACGNLLYNDEVKNIWFNESYKSPKVVINLLQYSDSSVPTWGKEYFQGINMKNSTDYANLVGSDLHYINFSNSFLRGVAFNDTNLYKVNFTNCTFEFCSFGYSHISKANFTNAKIIHYSAFALAHILQGCQFPYALAYKSYHLSRNDSNLNEMQTLPNLFDFLGISVNYGTDVTYMNIEEKEAKEVAEQLGQLLKYGYQTKVWTQEEIIAAFIISDEKAKELFDQILLKELKS